jgi:hypothetical protein
LTRQTIEKASDWTSVFHQWNNQSSEATPHFALPSRMRHLAADADSTIHGAGLK